MSYKVIEGSNVPIKAWIDGVSCDPKAEQQLRNMATLPFIFKHIAVMPDVHVGIGATIGSVIPTIGAIVPASVGVDLGCLAGDTWIPLWNGGYDNLRNLSKSDESFEVFSYDVVTGNVVKGNAKALKTRDNANLMSLRVGNRCKEIICTPDHEFLLTNGYYKQAWGFG